jgi:hypothetical protein
MYDKTGRSAEAVQAAHQALDLVEQAHDEQDATALRDVLDGYERDSAKVKSQ